MMHFIAHRGNFAGESQLENHPDYLLRALQKGFEVEIDIWYKDGAFALGHDEPQYEVGFDFLKNISNHSWFHAKNLQAMSALKQFNTFWHENDERVFTSKGFIWTFSEEEYNLNSVIVFLNDDKEQIIKSFDKCAGICSDNISEVLNDFRLLRAIKLKGKGRKRWEKV